MAEGKTGPVTEWVVGLVEDLGYAGIAVLMLLEIPVPLIQSEIVMTSAGFAASVGRLSLVPVIAAGVSGSQAGSLALFAAARRLPEERIRGFLVRHGDWLGLDEPALVRAEERFRRHGAVAVVTGRLLPGLRSFIAIPAGVVRLPLWQFFVFNLLGTVFWVTLLAVLGSALGARYELVDEYSSYVTVAFVGGLLSLVVYRVVTVSRRRRARR